MIVIFGLVILVAAVIAGVAGVLTNGGPAHEVTHFAVFGYHVTGSAGTLFLYGIITGALALAGLGLLLAGARRTSRRGRAARQSLRQSRRETAAVSKDRDNLIGQRDTARAYTVHDEQQNFTASTLGNGNASPLAGRDPRPGRPRLFARRPAGRPETLPGQAAETPAAQTPASASAPAE
jgi:hypothetical protein